MVTNVYALVMINDTQNCIEGIEFLKRKTSAVRKAVAYLTAPFSDESDERISYIFDPDSEGGHPVYDRYIYIGDRLHTLTTNEYVYGMTKILRTMQEQLEAKSCEDVTQYIVDYPVHLDDEAEAIREEK
jgi:hypothetical protein